MATKRKEASQRYREKKRLETETMKQEICGLRSKVVVLKYVNKQYKKENNHLRKQLADHMDSCICNMVKTVQIPACSRQVITQMPIYLSSDENSNYMDVVETGEMSSYGSSPEDDFMPAFRYSSGQTIEYLTQGINV